MSDQERIICDAAFSLSESRSLKVMLIIKCLLCIAGVAAILFLIKRKGVRWLVHPNAKFIFGAHVVFTVGISISFLAVYLIDLFRLSLDHDDHCDYRLVLWVPLNVRTLAVSFLFGQILTMTLLSFERLWASIRPVQYEASGNISAVTVAILTITMFSVLWCFGLVLPGNDLNEMVAGMVIRTAANKDRFQILGKSELVPECITLVIFHVVLIINAPRRHTKIGVNLANRYQVRENYRLTVLFLPIVWLHAVMFLLVSFGISSFPMFCPKGGAVQLAFFTELVAWIPLYSILLPIVILWRLRKTKVQTMKQQYFHQANYFQGVDELFAPSKKISVRD